MNNHPMKRAITLLGLLLASVFFPVAGILVGAALGEELPPRPVFAELLPAPYYDRAAKAMLADDGHEAVALSLVNLGSLLYDAGRHDEAEAMFREGREIRRLRRFQPPLCQGRRRDRGVFLLVLAAEGAVGSPVAVRRLEPAQTESKQARILNESSDRT